MPLAAAQHDQIGLAFARDANDLRFYIPALHTTGFGGYVELSTQRGESLPGPFEQLVFDLVANEAVANVAALMEESEEFERARSTSLGRIRESIPLPKRKRPQVPRRSSKGRAKGLSS